MTSTDHSTAPSVDGALAGAIERLLAPMVEEGLDKLPAVAVKVAAMAKAIVMMPAGEERTDLEDRLGDIAKVYMDNAGVRVAAPLHDVLAGSLSSLPALLQTGAHLARLFFPV